MSLSPELASAARSAPFVFFGTVRRPTGSNVEALDREDEPSAVVHVDRVVAAPEIVGDLAGKDVTVRLADQRVRRGQRLLFLATSLQYGAELALTEIARLPARGAEASTVIAEKLGAHDAGLLERLNAADLVVYGRVEEVDPVPPTETLTGEPVTFGEAKPGWRAARLLVWRALKGQPPEQPRVVYPFPRTQKWAEVPLFIAGQEGIWLLQAVGKEALAAGMLETPSVPDGFTAFDERDFQAAGLVERIQLLLDLGAVERAGR